jgi:hypothetical protein
MYVTGTELTKSRKHFPICQNNFHRLLSPTCSHLIVLIVIITYSKGCHGHFSWSFFTWLVRPSIHLIIHPWMPSYTEENPDTNKYPTPPPLLSRKGMPGPKGGTPKILISNTHTHVCIRHGVQTSSTIMIVTTIIVHCNVTCPSSLSQSLECYPFAMSLSWWCHLSLFIVPIAIMVFYCNVIVVTNVTSPSSLSPVL